MVNFGGKNKLILLAIIAVIVIIVILIIANIALDDNSKINKYNPISYIKSEKNVKSNEQLIKEYKKNANQVLEPYFKQQNFDSVLDELIELTVPLEYKDLHLNLVISFDKIKLGQTTSDQALIEEGMAEINGLVNMYTWLE